jgi:Fur family ferric uptake transcriptional regulator
MERENCCLDAHEIFMRLRAAGQKTGLTSVYRVLDLLQSLGLAVKVDFGAGTYKYELTRGGHHHHVVCSDCGSIGVFDDPAIELAVQHAAEQTGFAIDSHRVELFGRCGACQDGASASA